MTAATLADLAAQDRELNGAALPTSDPTFDAAPVTVPREWFTTQPPGRTWLLRDSRRKKNNGLLPLGRVGQIIGEGGASKTMAMMQLAISVATGEPWLGTFPVATKGRVLLVVGEEDAEEAHRRLYKSRLATTAPIPDPGTIVVIPLAGVPCAMLERDENRNMREAAFLPWLRAWLRAHGPWTLVIVDPLSRFGGPDVEIDNAAATRFIQCLESLAVKTGATVVVAHHTHKGARQGGAVQAAAGRGSSALVDGVRWQCSLGVERLTHETPEAKERLGEIVTWSHTKSNYSRRVDDLSLRRDLDNGGALVALDADDLARVEAARAKESGSAKKKIEREAGEETDRGTQDRALAGILQKHPSGIGARDLRAAMRAALGKCSSDATDAAVVRAVEAGSLRIEPGPRNGRLHLPASEGAS